MTSGPMDVPNVMMLKSLWDFCRILSKSTSTILTIMFPIIGIRTIFNLKQMDKLGFLEHLSLWTML